MEIMLKVAEVLEIPVSKLFEDKKISRRDLIPTEIVSHREIYFIPRNTRDVQWR